MKVTNIFGLKILSISRLSALKLIEKKIISKTSHNIAFVNAHLANLAAKDINLRKTLKSFILLNDGSGVNIAAKLLGYGAFPENLNGTDFTPYFLNNTDLKLSVFLLGSREHVVKKSAETFQEMWPQHPLVGYHHGFFGDEEFKKILLHIKSLKPDIVFIGMGNPIQEQVAIKILPTYAMSTWCVGACFEFISNQLPRAPAWMQALGIEWVFRLILEPKRLWKRYLIGNFVFIYHIAKQRFTS